MFKWFFALKTRLFLAGVVAAQSGELTALRNKLGQKDREITRTQADYRQCKSFYKQIVNNFINQVADKDAEIARLKVEVEFLSRDINPETEQDYIDQVMQEQADRAQVDDDPLPY